MKVFESKIDTWFYLLISILILACVAVVHKTMRVPNLETFITSLLIFLVGLGLPIWLLSSTKYIVEGNLLTVVSGPAKWEIPIDSITSVKDSRSLWSSPALSLDRLEINA